jgi:hypothetical protein
VSRLSVPEETVQNQLFKTVGIKALPEEMVQPKEGIKEQSLDIHVLTANYDQSKLVPIINVLFSDSKTS